jgi:hypothetical protein
VRPRTAYRQKQRLKDWSRVSYEGGSVVEHTCVKTAHDLIDRLRLGMTGGDRTGDGDRCRKRLPALLASLIGRLLGPVFRFDHVHDRPEHVVIEREYQRGPVGDGHGGTLR